MLSGEVSKSGVIVWWQTARSAIQHWRRAVNFGRNQRHNTISSTDVLLPATALQCFVEQPRQCGGSAITHIHCMLSSQIHVVGAGADLEAVRKHDAEA